MAKKFLSARLSAFPSRAKSPLGIDLVAQLKNYRIGKRQNDVIA